MKLIEMEFFHNMRMNFFVYEKPLSRFYYLIIVIVLFAGELFSDKRMNLIISQKLLLDFIGTES
jgi:hypothetical protein